MAARNANVDCLRRPSGRRAAPRVTNSLHRAARSAGMLWRSPCVTRSELMTRTPWLLGLLAAGCLTGSLTVGPSHVAFGNDQQEKDQLPMLNKTEREELVGGANRAWQKYAKSDGKKAKGNDLPKEFWGEAIERLKPLRVYNDRV